MTKKFEGVPGTTVPGKETTRRLLMAHADGLYESQRREPGARWLLGFSQEDFYLGSCTLAVLRRVDGDGTKGAVWRRGGSHAAADFGPMSGVRVSPQDNWERLSPDQEASIAARRGWKGVLPREGDQT